MTLQNFTLGTFAQGGAGGGGAFESIATVTASGGEVDLTLGSIPNTYQHLQVRFLVKSNNTGTGLAGLYGYANGNTSSVYAIHELSGDGSTTTASGSASQTIWQYGALPKSGNATSAWGVGIIDLLDYKSTSKTKTIRCFAGWDRNGGGNVYLLSNLLNSTSAISSLTFQDLTTTGFTAGSTFALYGIKGA